EEAAEVVVHGTRRQSGTALGEAIQVLLRHVDAAAPQVARHVLPEVGELERGANVVRARLALRVAVAEEREHDAPDRVGRAAAVREDVGEGREGGRVARGIAPEGGEQVAQRLERQVAARDRVAERQEDGIDGARGVARGDAEAHAASAPGRAYSRRWLRTPAKTNSPAKSAGGSPPASPPRTSRS